MSDKTSTPAPEQKPVTLEGLDIFAGVGPETLKQIKEGDLPLPEATR